MVVRVVVRDSQGHAVGNLKKEDFQLFDSGKLQTISRFAVEQPSARTIPVTDAGQSGEKSATAPESYVAYLFDDLHTQAADIALARQAATHQLNALPPSARAAIYTTSGVTMLDFTDDRAKWQSALADIHPRPVAGSTGMGCPEITYYFADQMINKHDGVAATLATQNALDCQFNGDPRYITQAQNLATAEARRQLAMGDEQTRLALGTLRDIIRRISLMPGQRTVVLVSPGFIVTINDLTYETEIIDRALHSNVIVSTLDVRGLYTVNAAGDIADSHSFSPSMSAPMLQYTIQGVTAQDDVLSELAYGTGGTYFHNSNDLKEGFRRTAAPPEYYYVLGFAPQNLKSDGKYHSLKVTLTGKPPLTLQARKGYYAPKHVENVAEQAKQDIQDAVFSQEERNDLPVELHTKFFKTSDENAQLAVLVRVDVRHLHYRRVDGRNRNDLTVVAALFDRNGNFVKGDQKTLEMRLTDETLEKKLGSGVTLRANFDVKAGSYLVRCVVRDDQGQLSAENGAVEIP